jgi:chalcone isomerase-like protein
MKNSPVKTLGCAAVLAMLTAPTHHSTAVAAQLEGATLTDTLKAGDKTLKLNGLGLRKKAAFDKMLALVPDVKEGSTMTFTYVPGKGTTLQVADKELGVFEGKGFADAVFSIWLGPKPPSEDLRKGMLD